MATVREVLLTEIAAAEKHLSALRAELVAGEAFLEREFHSFRHLLEQLYYGHGGSSFNNIAPAMPPEPVGGPVQLELPLEPPAGVEVIATLAPAPQPVPTPAPPEAPEATVTATATLMAADPATPTPAPPDAPAPSTIETPPPVVDPATAAHIA